MIRPRKASTSSTDSHDDYGNGPKGVDAGYRKRTSNAGLDNRRRSSNVSVGSGRRPSVASHSHAHGPPHKDVRKEPMVPKLVPAIGLYVLLRALDGKEQKMRIELPRSYIHLQRLFAEKFPKHQSLLVVERLNGVTVSPLSTNFVPEETILFREFRPLRRDPPPPLCASKHIRRPMDLEIRYVETDLPSRERTKAYVLPGALHATRRFPKPPHPYQVADKAKQTDSGKGGEGADHPISIKKK